LLIIKEIQAPLSNYLQMVSNNDLATTQPGMIMTGMYGIHVLYSVRIQAAVSQFSNMLAAWS